ncbi:MAG TPA: surface-adhesin E family protein [Gemmatimonadaceae bacterium]|nr:surface-adhesin E family protein [Gemmatimonadaceae bacterium]
MDRFVSRLLLVAAFAAVPAAAHSQAPWRQVYRDSDVTVIFDTASISLQSPGTWNTVTSWDYTRPRILENKKAYTRLVERAYVRCSPVRIKRVRSTVYGANNLLVRDEGEVDPRDQTHMVWDRPKAGTAGKNAFDAVCGILTRKAGVNAIVPAAKPIVKAPVKKTTATKKTTKKS